MPNASAFLCLQHRTALLSLKPYFSHTLFCGSSQPFLGQAAQEIGSKQAHRFQKGGVFWSSVHSSYEVRTGAASLPLAGAASFALSTCLVLSACMHKMRCELMLRQLTARHRQPPGHIQHG